MPCHSSLSTVWPRHRRNRMQGLVRQRVFGPQLFGKPPDEAKVEEALEGLEMALVVLDRRLATNKYLAGGR